MTESGYYPPGAEFDPSAPYNEPVIPEVEFEITCCQCLSKTTVVTTSWKDKDDTSETNWGNAYKENSHYTPLELIEQFRSRLIEELNTLKNSNDINVLFNKRKKIKEIKHLIEECDGWIDNELVFEQE